MSEAAAKPMTLDEFLHWDDGTETRYELVAGFPLAMAPPARGHRILAARLAAAIEARLRSRRPRAAEVEARIARPDRDDSVYIADLAVSCRPYRPGEQLAPDPILIIEILSPGTERHDRLTKVPAYRDIETVTEILLIDAESSLAEVLRREGAQWVTELVRGRDSVLRLASVDLAVPMAELYDGIGGDGSGAGERSNG
jgi:Uma2 family endonuclease